MNSSTYKSFLAGLLPSGLRLSLLKMLVKKATDGKRLAFPLAFSAPPRILVILPEDPLYALKQLSFLMSLIAHFKNGRFSVLCTGRVAPFFRIVNGISEFIEYDPQDRFLFSKEFDRIGKEIGGGFDLCLLLERGPDISLQLIAGLTAATARIGYEGCGDYPFLNVQVKPSPVRTFSAERSLPIASLLGAPYAAAMRLTVSKDTQREIGLMLSEMNIAPSSRIISIDGQYFFTHFGEAWTTALVQALAKKPFVCCIVAHDEVTARSQQVLASLKLPVFSPLPASRFAGLVHRSEFIIAGNTLLFELADLFKKPVAGVFEEQEYAASFRETDTTRGIRFVKHPDTATIDSIVGLLAQGAPSQAKN
jgi:ADP-heptose:LPS heptosyltransferase